MAQRSEIKRKNKKTVKLSVPKTVYIAIFIMCAFLIAAKFIINKDLFGEISANIGYSLFASNVAGILFDLGTNISDEKRAKKQFFAVTNSHSQLLNDIIVIADDSCNNLNIDGFCDMLFKEQLAAALYNNLDSEFLKSQEYYEATEQIFEWLDLVRRNSEELLKISYIMYENAYFTEKKRITLRLLSKTSDEAIKLTGNRCYESNKELCRLIEDVIIRMLLKLYPEQKSLFEDEY